MLRPISSLLLVLCLTCLTAACASGPCVPAVTVVPADQIPDAPWLDVPAFAVVAPGVAIGGQPSYQFFEQAGDNGYVTVVNLRTAEESAKYEELTADHFGMRYESIPVDGLDIRSGQADDLADILAPGTGRPMLVHCGSGARAAGVWALYLVRHQCYTPEAALDELDSLGVLDPELRETLERRMAE